jgi:hypothetical protein
MLLVKEMASLDNLIDVPEADQVLQNKLSIESLEQKVGSGSISTTNATIIGGVNELHIALVSTQGITNGNTSSVSSIQTVLGEQSLPNTALSVKHAINQNHANIATKAENTEVTQLENRIQTNENDISPLKTTMGTITLPNTFNSVTHGVTVNQTNIASNVNSISALQTLNGSANLSTTSQTIKAAINENQVIIQTKADTNTTNTRFTTIENTIGNSTFSGTLKNSITSNTNSINSLNTILNVNASANKIQSLETSITNINSSIGSDSLHTNLTATALVNAINEVYTKTTTDATADASARQSLDQKINTETTRASGVETSINEKIGDINAFSSVSSTISGAISTLSTNITNLTNTVNALNTLIRSQKTLIVTTAQDHRSTDLTSFSEIVILQGGTLIVTYEQANAIHTKMKSANDEWVLTFANNGNLKVLHASTTTVDVSATTFSFTQLDVQNGTFSLTAAQYMTLASVVKSGSGAIKVFVNNTANMSSVSLTPVTELRVRATLSLNVAQILTVNLVVEQQGNLTLVVTEESDVTGSSVLSSANAITVSALLIATPQQISDVSSKITKSGNGSITAKITTTSDITNLTTTHINNFILNSSTVIMTPTQAELFRNNITDNSSTIKLLETSNADYTALHVENWNFDELLMQNSVITVTPNQTNFLKDKTISKNNSSITTNVSQNTNLTSLDLTSATTIEVAANVTIQINKAQALLTLTKGSNSNTQLITSGSEDLSLSTISVDQIHNSGTLRINTTQLSIPIENSGTVILSLRASNAYTSLNLSPIAQLELLENAVVEFTDDQINGKGVIATNGSLKVHATKDVSAYTLPAIHTLVVGGSVTITTGQHNNIGAVTVQSGSLTLFAANENITSVSLLPGVTRVRCKNTVTATARQFNTHLFEKETGAILNLTSALSIDLTSKDLSVVDTLVHSNNTIMLTAGQLAKLSLVGGTLTVHVVSLKTYNSTFNAATSIIIKSNGTLDYTADGSNDSATTAILNKITNNGTLILRNAYKAPTNNLTSGVLKLPTVNVTGALAWPISVPLTNSTAYTISDNLVDTHGKSSTSYQWLKDAGQGYTNISEQNNLNYTVQSTDVGANLKIRASWTIDWLKTNNDDVYNASLAPLAREVFSEARFVNNVGSGTITVPKAINDMLVGDSVTVQVQDPDGVSNPTFTWKRNGASIGSGSSYTLQPVDFGKSLSVSFSYTDSKGSSESGLVSMSQLPSITSSYNGSPSNLAVGTNLPTVSITKNAQIQSTQWYTYPHNGSKSSSSLLYSQTTVLGTSGANFYARITLSDSTIVETFAIPVQNHSPSGSLTINGVFNQSQTLTLSSTIQDSNLKSNSNANGDVTVGDLSIKWFRSDDNNQGNKTLVSTSSTYTIVQADNGKYLHVEGTYTEGSTTHTVSSALIYDNVDGSLAITTHNSSSTSINASMLMAGDSLKATVTDVDGFNSVAYVWKTGTNVIGNTQTYVVQSADFNKTLTCEATYTDNLSRADTITNQISLSSQPVLSLRDASGRVLSGATTSPVVLNVPVAFVGLPYQVYVNGALASSGTTSENTNINVVNPEGKTVYARVERVSSDFKNTQTIKFATVNITTNSNQAVSTANVGTILKANISGITSTIVSFYFDGIVISRGTLGLHVLTQNDMGNKVYCVVEDSDGFAYQSETYTVP